MPTDRPTPRPPIEGREVTELPTPTIAGELPDTREIVFGTFRERLSTVFDAAGVAELVFGPAPNFAYWLVGAITVSSTSTSTTEARVYVGDPSSSNLVDGTASGDLDFSDRADPILVSGGEVLTVRWTGGSSGAEATAVIQYRLARVDRR